MQSRSLATILTIAGAILFATSCLTHHGGAEPSGDLPEQVSYNFNIRPVLSDKCFKCHGPDAAHREAHLRLDIADSAYAPLHVTKGAFAIVPGNPEASLLLKRVVSQDPGFMMPPPDAHLGAFSEYEQQLFTKWIRQGAKYEKHWAFTPPLKAPVPKLKDPRKSQQRDRQLCRGAAR